MCRNIHTLFNFEPPATDDEVRAASLQYVRKISGFTKPSQANEQAFERAVAEVAEASKRLLDSLGTNASPKDREVETDGARARGGASVWRIRHGAWSTATAAASTTRTAGSTGRSPACAGSRAGSSSAAG